MGKSLPWHDLYRPSWVAAPARASKDRFFILNSSQTGSRSFKQVVDTFLAGEGLPFSQILNAKRIQQVFAKCGSLFGQRGVYNTAVVVWAFISQVLGDGKEASRQAAVARIVAFYLQTGIQPPTQDTGDYCRARAKVSITALHELTCMIADDFEQQVDIRFHWKERHAAIIDGFTFTMPDTAENQAAYPQSKSQKPGVGLPIARAVAILSFATTSVIDAAYGPYSGKESGEIALLRCMLRSLKPGDVAVMDWYCCSFMTIALLLHQGTDTCARKHHRRHSDFHQGQQLGKYHYIITWSRPQRPG